MVKPVRPDPKAGRVVTEMNGPSNARRQLLFIEAPESELLNGRRVDLITPKFLNARIREQVMSSAESLYVAA